MIDHWHNVRQEYRQRLPGHWSRVAQALVSAQSRPWRSDPLTVRHGPCGARRRDTAGQCLRRPVNDGA